MGQVFAAVHERMGQKVALKILSPAAAGDRQLVARLLQEARALAQLEHPGVVRVLNCDQLDDGTVYLAMELLEGLSLREWMRRQPCPAPLKASLALGRQIADVMVDVHAKGIVHRDLKPENVFLCPDESVAPGYRTRLLDFGIAKVPPSADGARMDTQVQTVAPIFIGTATYMAPEQCRNAAEVDGRADVYALGVLLFEFLAGRPPFVSNEAIEVISMHVHEEPPPLQEFAPALPGALSTFIASMLAKEPAQRPTMLRCRDMLGRAWESERDECPVPGLAPFTEAQAELFFGRKVELDELLELLEQARTGERRWVQLEGPSGVGKSSLVQAGLLPRLKESPSQGEQRWRAASMRPSYDPLRSLALALVAAYAGTGFDQTPENIERTLRTGPDALRALVTTHTPAGCCFLLVLEQMEELFTLGAEDCHQLDALVSTALAAPESPLRLLTTLRSDFIHRLEQLPRLARQLNQAARYHLRAMEEEALTQVIQGMAQRAGLRLSEGLPERMVREARSEGSQLPLLGHTLRGLWSSRSGALLTHERYEQLGGVGGALARQAEQLLDGLGDEGRERAKWLLLELVQVGRGVPDTRRPRSRREVFTAAGGDELAEQVLMRLSGMRTSSSGEAQQDLRLVVLSAGLDPDQQRVDLVHETLLQKVPSIVGWIEDERALLEWHSDLEVAAHDWELEGYPSERLPSGSLLARYREHTGLARQRSHATRVTSDRAVRFLDAAQRLERRHTWLKRALVLASVAAMAAIAFSAVRATRAQQHAEVEQKRAEERLQQLLNDTEQFISNADWDLGRLLHTLDIRRSMQQQHDKTLASLPEQEREKLPVRMMLIKTWHRRGDLAYWDDSLARTDAFLLDGLKEIQKGLARNPADEGLVFQLGLNHSKRGKVALARGQWEATRGHFNEAIKLFERPPTGHQGDSDLMDYRRTLATSYSELAELELALGRVDAAASQYDRAIALFERNSAQSDKSYDMSLLADALCSRGETAHRSGDLQAAEAHLTRALSLGRDLVAHNSGDGLLTWTLARILVELAEVETAQAQRGAATGHYREAQELGRKLLEGEQVNKRYALVLIQALRGDEQLARALGDHDRAERLHTERCALVNDFVGRDSEDVRFQSLACP
ncbi:protein kinase domain-containing protein [Archangium violaceum]|uniref:nSTAND1 domain-containing NTPase n=1 Tax=Archangium violaceum TaxID=83451 RepID=UPI001EF505EA|nr:protein kinase [Archangium violaceum]